MGNAVYLQLPVLSSGRRPPSTVSVSGEEGISIPVPSEAPVLQWAVGEWLAWLGWEGGAWAPTMSSRRHEVAWTNSPLMPGAGASGSSCCFIVIQGFGRRRVLVIQVRGGKAKGVGEGMKAEALEGDEMI